MGWVFGAKERFYLHEGESLLDGLLRTGNDTPYECRQGYCGMCKTRLIVHSGEIYHRLPPLCLLESDEVLACCCMATGTIELTKEGDDSQLSLLDIAQGAASTPAENA